MSLLGWCLTSHHESCPSHTTAEPQFGIAAHTCACDCHDPKGEA